jgi:hypothetical protein
MLPERPKTSPVKFHPLTRKKLFLTFKVETIGKINYAEVSNGSWMMILVQLSRGVVQA